MQKIKRCFMLLAALLLITQGVANAEPLQPGEVDKYLQVSSPDWRDQIIYFIVTDRFNDGDPSNNNQGANEYDPTTNAKYSGGDLKGVMDKLDYIKNLGMTAIWITPPVANQWWNPWEKYSGYHGYWAENFTEVDKHMGTLSSYKELSASLHKNGMYLVQDVIVNHMGDFMRYNGEYDPNDPTKNFELNIGSSPVSKPSQYPFSLNNVKMPDQKKAAIYHWTSNLANYNDRNEVLTHQLSGLDDLNTENPVVRNALRDSYSYWIKEVGVDAFRLDTVKYVPEEFFNDFIHSKDKKHLGVAEFAKTLGKNDFYTFGEEWVSPNPYTDDGDKEAAAYEGTKEKPGMDAMINFPVNTNARRVFAEGAPTAYLTYSMKNAFKFYRNPYKLANFIDNHDMNRILAIGQYTAMTQGIAFIMTIPGVPIVYYGTEQDFTESRGCMFAKGYASGGMDNFDENSDSYKYIQKVANIRKKYDALRRGQLTTLKDSKVGPGPLAYKMEYNGQTAVMLFNTSDAKILMDNVNTGLKEGTLLKDVLGDSPREICVGKNGTVSLLLEPKETLILLAANESKNTTPKNKAVTIENFKNGVKLSDNFTLKGSVKGASKVLVVIDNSIDEALKVDANSDGSWETVLPVSSLDDGPHTMVAYVEGEDNNDAVVSNTYDFDVSLPVLKSVEYQDKIGDDKGPNGNYLYPTDKSYKHQMDIEKVTVYKVGNKIKLSLKMADELSVSWGPSNGFDHVCFNVYVDLPGTEGAVDMPFLNGKVKDGMQWDYLLFLTGWANAVYEKTTSSANNFGSAVSVAAKLTTDKDNRTIDILIPAKAIGKPEKLEGIKLYITTWDYNGLENKYQKYAKEVGPFIFGGVGPTDPLVMDDTDIIEVK